MGYAKLNVSEYNNDFSACFIPSADHLKKVVILIMLMALEKNWRDPNDPE